MSALFSTQSSPYSLLLLVAIAASLFTWTRLARRDHRLVLIYVAALLSAFIGAKLVYVLAEGWLDWPMPDRWLRLATGKSVLGALLGGYAYAHCVSSRLSLRRQGYLHIALLLAAVAAGPIIPNLPRRTRWIELPRVVVAPRCAGRRPLARGAAGTGVQHRRHRDFPPPP